ncbi:hypothetical protein [Pedobacter gandavensis]|uniref:DNA recombination protein RmuC n=1 Tax=Pedobacter gandavensis TaxID=2679963 RepID=A0ABR6EWJ7_9SPHI|nr:hypothetical protein [Pedobacter gandavensis]MBB2149174.1 hypothetical protein [Pedobacter gandavensis]
MTTIELVIALLSTAGGTAWLTAFLNRKKSEAETGKIISETYQDVIDSLRKEISRLEERLTLQEQQGLKYLDIIAEQRKTENELREKLKSFEKMETKSQKRIAELESEVSQLKIRQDHEQSI